MEVCIGQKPSNESSNTGTVTVRRWVVSIKVGLVSLLTVPFNTDCDLPTIADLCDDCSCVSTHASLSYLVIGL